MYLKKTEKIIIFSIITIIFISFLFISLVPFEINNETYYIIPNFLKIKNMDSFVALIVGILAFIGTIYNTDKTSKMMKVSAIPEKSANLLMDLGFTFNEYEIYKKQGNGDEFILLTQILLFWREHQYAFKLLTPNFYKNFIKLISKEEIIRKNNITPIKNSKYVIMAIITHITNIALLHDESDFSFIKSDLINDDNNLKELGEDSDNYCNPFKFNKIDLNNYINTINGFETRKLTEDKFSLLKKDINKLLRELKREIEDCD